MPKIFKSGPGVGFLDLRYVNITGDTMTGAMFGLCFLAHHHVDQPARDVDDLGDYFAV